MRRVPLGTWSTPTGNSVDVYLGAGDGHAHAVEIVWDEYPLSPADEVFYLVSILPAVTREVQLFLERPGKALVVRT